MNIHSNRILQLPFYAQLVFSGMQVLKCLMVFITSLYESAWILFKSEVLNKKGSIDEEKTKSTVESSTTKYQT